MSREETLLIGDAGSDTDITRTLVGVLAVEPTVVDDEPYFELPTGIVRLDTEPLDLADPADPDYEGMEYALRVGTNTRDVASQQALAREIYDVLVRRTSWGVKLMDGDWGPIAASRPALARSA